MKVGKVTSDSARISWSIDVQSRLQYSIAEAKPITRTLETFVCRADGMSTSCILENLPSESSFSISVQSCAHDVITDAIMCGDKSLNQELTTGKRYILTVCVRHNNRGLLILLFICICKWKCLISL